MAGDSKGSGGVKKYGRNATKGQRYRMAGRREKNKARKAARHAKHLADAAQRRKRNTET